MPTRPRHPCNHPGCHELTNARFCAEHARQEMARYEAQRGTATERGYDGQWAKARSVKLSRNPLCERCLAQGRIIAAVLVHHRDRNPKNNAEDNLESLCDPCHDEEHKEERWARK